MQDIIVSEAIREEVRQEEMTPRGGKSRVRLRFDEGAQIAPPDGFSNRETWAATLWLNALAEDAAHVRGWVDDLPQANADEIRRWFHHRFESARDGQKAQWIALELAGIGSLWRIEWDEVARHYKRCPWAATIQDAFGAAREVGLDVDPSGETRRRRRQSIGAFLGRSLASCRELSGEEWARVAQAITKRELTW